MITVDVEAQPRRAERDPVDRLIWGKFPQGRAGIGEMMDIADRHGVKLTMFLDFCERDIHGEAIRDVGREIHRRGHDLQLHAHPDFMATEFWAEKGLPRIGNLNETTPEQAAVLFDFLVEEYELATGERPLAYRGGGYRFNQHSLDAMAKRGIMCHSSYNPPRKTQPLEFDFKKQFKWSNGIIEVPVSCVKKYANLSYPLEFNFNISAFSDVNHMKKFLDLFYTEFGEEAIAVLVMHSWSLLEFDRDSGHFIGPASANAERLYGFLEAISQTHEVMTAKDLLALSEQGGLPLDPPLDMAIFNKQTKIQETKPEKKARTHISQDIGAAELSALAERLWNDPEADKAKAFNLFMQAFEKGDRAMAGYRLGCAYYDGIGVSRDIAKAFEYFSILELDNSRYALFYRGRILKNSAFHGHDLDKAWKYLKRSLEMGVELAAKEMQDLPEPSDEPVKKACPICGADASRFEKLDGRQCPDCGSLERQRVFALAYDREISKRFDIKGKHGLVISPSVSERRFFRSRGVGRITSVDIRPEAGPDIVADICDMPHVQSSAYDFVYASYVFPCVHDLDAAFREIQRVLKPGGCLLSVDHLKWGAETEEFTDENRITSWYGDENYRKYKVGSFRSLGEKGLIKHLSRYFVVCPIRAVDPIKDLEMAVIMSRKENSP